jgi:hypothetical protein
MAPWLPLVQSDNTSSGLYLYEYPIATQSVYAVGGPFSNKTWESGRAHLMLRKENAPSSFTYYRLDFYNSADSSFYDLKRNHKYIFTINHVRSDGYPSEAEAMNNPGSNIEYEIKVNDGEKNLRTISNGQYGLGVIPNNNRISSDTVSVLLDGSGSSHYGMVAYVKQYIPAAMGSSAPASSITLTGDPDLFLHSTSVTTLDNTFREIRVSASAPPNLSTVSLITIRLGNITYHLHLRVAITT